MGMVHLQMYIVYSPAMPVAVSVSGINLLALFELSVKIFQSPNVW